MNDFIDNYVADRLSELPESCLYACPKILMYLKVFNSSEHREDDRVICDDIESLRPPKVNPFTKNAVSALISICMQNDLTPCSGLSEIGEYRIGDQTKACGRD